jgi:hypothetical protein
VVAAGSIGGPPSPSIYLAPASISVSKVKVVQNAVLGRKYVLEASHDTRFWSEVMAPFSATGESITNEFDADLTGRFFRVRETLNVWELPAGSCAYRLPSQDLGQVPLTPVWRWYF